ncbi:MAG TPA: hypothetical protein VNK46_11740 [Nitrospiraceae bacterium]|jgi:hypothetical protein|nr:hypothetical protein [Nitrospiraceae bacterium]
MSGFVRVMIAVGVVALFAGGLTFWRLHERPASSPAKVVGSSALSHGEPIAPSTMPAAPSPKRLPILPGQRAMLIEMPPAETEVDRFTEPVSVHPDESLAAGRPGTEVIVTNVETRPAPNGRVEQFFQVRFPDGRSAWVHQDVLRMPAPQDDFAYTTER